MVKLIQDVGNVGDKIEIEIAKSDLHYEILRCFKWRKNKSDIGYNISRFRKLGTSQYDRFIEHLHSKGY